MFGYKELDITDRLLVLKALCELRAKVICLSDYTFISQMLEVICIFLTG